MIALPIDPLLPSLVASLDEAKSLVLSADPGAGKTTRVPRAMLDHGLAGKGEIVVLEPRRLATRLAARRVAEELGEKAGETVGYQVRFEDVSSARTRIRFVTEGLLTRRLLSDPELRGVSAVVLDEFHERHLHADLALALLRRMQLGPRPDLRLVVMSATLDAAPIAAYLACPAFRSEGRRFEVAVEHAAAPDDRPLALQVAAAVRRLAREGLDGHVLVFLPGAAEIRKAREACEPLARELDLQVLPLHGDLSPEEQDRAVRPGSRRKLILSTNVAETSVTIDGVAAVVDSGLARIAGHSPWSGLSTLEVGPISRASATQRAGRAGRTREGRCLRLYTKRDFETRREFDAPEIARLDLCELALALHASGVPDLGEFGWFQPPQRAALAAARELLSRLGAVTNEGTLTDVGRRMLRFPLHPRQARILVEAEARGAGESGAVVAALVGERGLRARQASERGRAPDVATGPSDLLALLELFEEAESAGFDRDKLRWMGLDAGATFAVDRGRRQLERLLGSRGPRRRSAASPADEQTALSIAILTGYPDRVARRRSVAAHHERASAGNLVFAGGGTAALAETSVVRTAPLVVAVDAEERRGAQTIVRLASAIEPEWLLELYPARIRDVTEVAWNAAAERVETTGKLTYDGVVLDEAPAKADPAEVARVLAEAALARGPAAFEEGDALSRWLARTEVVAGLSPGFPRLGDDDARAALASLCEGRRSFAELREASLLGELRARLDAKQADLLARLAPDRVRLARGREVKVAYEPGKQPYVESRLQDFFGMTDGPRVGGGKLPLVLHLLAPNQRAVQVTSDLAGFWDRHYPKIRRELCRRYPRHAWPEDPLA